MDCDGFVKISRGMLGSGLFKNPNAMTLWMWILLRATWKESKEFVGHQVIDLKPGQLIFKRRMAAESLGLSEGVIYRCLKSLENRESIVTKTHNKYTIITVVNWDIYQGQKHCGEQQVNSRRTTNEQETDGKRTALIIKTREEEGKKGRKKEKDVYPSSGGTDPKHSGTEPHLVNSGELTDTHKPSQNKKSKNRYPEGFLKFWVAYPRKVGKEAAFKAYRNIEEPRPSMGVILKSISDHMSTRQWVDKSFIPNPSTYLNQRRWEDEFSDDDFQKPQKGGLQSDFSNVKYTGTDIAGIDWIPDEVKKM